MTEEPLLKESELTKAMGYETIIVDDGWQTLDSNRGHAYTGDWNPDRIPKMRELVGEIGLMPKIKDKMFRRGLMLKNDPVRKLGILIIPIVFQTACLPLFYNELYV